MARLPVYLRSLMELADGKASTISSERLAEMAGVNAAKVRKDLSYLGSYGTRGGGQLLAGAGGDPAVGERDEGPQVDGQPGDGRLGDASRGGDRATRGDGGRQPGVPGVAGVVACWTHESPAQCRRRAGVPTLSGPVPGSVRDGPQGRAKATVGVCERGNKTSPHPDPPRPSTP